MPQKKSEGVKPAEKKNKADAVKGIRLSASSAKLGFIYAEVLGPPVSKRRRGR
jgi:hypothetical protein